MKTVILCGGLGSRLAEETEVKPKPMVGIGGRPILWHILKHYAHYGFREPVLALGYKGEEIQRFFQEYPHHDEWLVHPVDTGHHTQTGGRIRRLAALLGKETFMLTYGDGVSNVDLNQLLAFHRAHQKLATVTAVRPPARFGGLVFEGDLVKEFTEKPQIGEGWINGGFFVLEPQVLDYLKGDDTVFEREPLEQLARDRQLVAYRHEGFWQCMDTLRDARLLEALWQSGHAPWKVWD